MNIKSYSKEIKKEIKILLPIIIPLMAAQLTHSAIGFVDTLMAGNISALDLAAVSVGSSVWFIVSLFATGILIAVTPTIAQLKGANKTDEIPSVIQQGFWLAVVLGIMCFFILQNAHPLFIWMKTDPLIIPLATKYIKAISWGAPFLTIAFVLRGYIEGLGHTRPIFFISLLSLIVNCIANYVLIYGKCGFPELGGVGCGWASSFSLLVALTVTYLFVTKNRMLSSIHVFKNFEFIQISKIASLVKVGFPIGMAIFAEVSTFSVISILISSISPKVVASHQIAMSITSFLFMIPLSIGLGSTIRIGHNIGQKNYKQARITCMTNLILGLGFACIIALFIYCFAYQISDLYSNDPIVIIYASKLLMYAVVFQISDAAQVVFACCLRGYKDTTYPMFITIAVYWGMAVPIGYILGMTNWIVAPMQAAGFWIGLVGGLTLTAIFLGVRLYFTSLKLTAIDHELKHNSQNNR